MNRIVDYVKKNYVLCACAFIVMVLFLTMAIFWIKKGTFSIDDDPVDNITISCPETAGIETEIECDINLTSDFRYKIMSINANYDFAEGIEYVTFGVNDQCEEGQCLEVYASTENGFAVLNENGLTSNTLVGKLRVKTSANNSPNTNYKVGLKTIELAVEVSEGNYECAFGVVAGLPPSFAAQDRPERVQRSR